MKKILCLILVIVLGLSFSGCVESKEEPVVMYGIDRQAELKDLKIVATEIKAEHSFSSLLGTGNGNIFVIIKFEIKNISSSSLYISRSDFEAYCDDVKVKYSWNSLSDYDRFESGFVEPDRKFVGYYSIEVPYDWEKIEITYKKGITSKNTATFIFTS